MFWLKQAIKENRKIKLEDAIKEVGSKYPLLLEFKNTPQDKEWHTEGDVHIHVNMVINETYKIIEANKFTEQDQFILLMAAIFHDIAKPLVTKEKEIKGKIRVVAPQHEEKGMSYLFYKFLEEDMTKPEREQILDLVGYHQKPKFLVIKNQSEWQYRLLTENTPGYLFYYHEVADMKGRTCSDLQPSLDMLEEFRMFCEEYDCFHKTGSIKNAIKNHFLENFKFEDENSLSYLINKTYSDLINNEYNDPSVGYSKHFTNKEKHSKLFILCGLSGSGKSTAIEKVKQSNNVDVVISLDELRKNHKINNTNRKKVDGRVLQEAKLLLKQALANHKNVIWDSTNLRKDFRKIIADLGRQYNAETHLAFIVDSVSNCIKKDKKRIDSVGDLIIRKQEKEFQFPELSETECYLMIENY